MNNGWIDNRIGREMDRRKDVRELTGWTGRRAVQMDRQRMDGWLDEWVGGQMDESEEACWTDGWLDSG